MSIKGELAIRYRVLDGLSNQTLQFNGEKIWLKKVLILLHFDSSFEWNNKVERVVVRLHGKYAEFNFQDISRRY